MKSPDGKEFSICPIAPYIVKMMKFAQILNQQAFVNAS
jgi:hypothetical protein